MNYKMIFYFIGYVLLTVAVLMLFPLLVAVWYREPSGIIFLYCSVAIACIGGLLTRMKPENSAFYAKDSFVVTALSWIVMSVAGSLPFYFSSAIPRFTDALFECVSGFTTTGASILPEVECLPNCMNFWRCLTQLIGGMGVIVFMLALIPSTGGQDLYLMKAESPGVNVGKLVPKVKKTAFYLYTIYFALTSLMIVGMVIAGAPVFDSICTSFTTTSTGGFGIRNTSLGAYPVAVQYVVAVFLFFSGINYSFYFYLAIRRFKDAFKMEEFLLYSLIFWGAVIVILLTLTKIGGYGMEEGFRAAFLQVGSIMTTAGFSSVDFDQWPSLAKTILVMLMFAGGCAGSTCGGIKISRLGIYMKTVRKEIRQLCHPRMVKVIKVDGKPLPHNHLRSANIFLISYLFIFVISLLLVSVDNYDFTTNFTAVASALGNIGPGLSMVGPTKNFALYSDFSKIVLMFDMIAGRLEIFPLLVLFSPVTWKKNS